MVKNFKNTKSIDDLIKKAEADIINLTPHDIQVCSNEGEVIETFPPSGQIARLSSMETEEEPLKGYPVVRTEYGNVENLPEEGEGKVYIVSAMIGQVLSGKRNDIYSPDTGPKSVVRDEKGNIKGVKRFIKW